MASLIQNVHSHTVVFTPLQTSTQRITSAVLEERCISLVCCGALTRDSKKNSKKWISKYTAALLKKRLKNILIVSLEPGMKFSAIQNLMTLDDDEPNLPTEGKIQIRNKGDMKFIPFIITFLIY